MKAKFRPQRRAGRPAHGCYPGATGSKTIPNCEDCCNCCGEGRTPAVEPKTRSRNEANSSFLFNKGSKWKPNSVSARLRYPPDATQMQPHATLPKQNRCNPAVATRFTPIPARNGFSPSSPALPIRLARNGADTMKLNDLHEIGFVRQKNAELHCPTARALDSRQSLQSPSGAQASPSPSTAPHANSSNFNGNGFVCPVLHPARITPPTHKSAQSRPIAHNRRKPPAPGARSAPPPPPCFSPQI